ncbi:HEPN domain-containing protein [Catenulispora subtropica]|uniref:RiboL-PSP-HEPN domain-containing protein n=1 Tax=Catenulispora subtropica TaxID=450798 RepID=A0ABN2TBP4_9ACTN
MTSQARDSFDDHCGDIDRLFQIHVEIYGEGPGRRWQVESLHKSAVVLLTAFWEAFCEDLAAEALAHLVVNAREAADLPTDLRRLVAKELKSDDHELAVWSVADDGWRELLTSRLARLQAERNRKLNTPKTAQIDDLFDKAVGLSKISSSWSWNRMSRVRAAEKLDGFVELRGEIAHRGSAVDSVTKDTVSDFYNHVKRLVDATEGHVRRRLRESTGVAPWE